MQLLEEKLMSKLENEIFWDYEGLFGKTKRPMFSIIEKFWGAKNAVNRTAEIMNLIEDLDEIIDGYNEIFVSVSSLNKKPIISIACRPETKSYNEPGDYNHRLENLCLKWKDLKDSRKQKSKKINHSQESVKHWNKYTEGWIKELEKAYQEGKPEAKYSFLINLEASRLGLIEMSLKSPRLILITNEGYDARDFDDFEGEEDDEDNISTGIDLLNEEKLEFEPICTDSSENFGLFNLTDLEKINAKGILGCSSSAYHVEQILNGDELEGFLEIVVSNRKKSNKKISKYEVYFMGFIETIVSEKVEEIKKEIPGIKSKKAKSRLISMIASEIENLTGKNHDDARDYVLYIQQYHTRDYYSPVPLITVTSNQESTEIKSRLESLGVKIEVAGVDNFLEIQKDIDKSDATDFKTKLEEIGVQVKIVASIKGTEPYINVEVENLISYPSIHAYGFSGSGANGWNGELELDKKGVSLVSLKS